MQKAIEQLEFNQILIRVEKELQLELSRDFSQANLQVKTSFTDVRFLQSLTNEFYQYFTRFGAPELRQVFSMKELLSKCEREQVLEIVDFLQILQLYDNINRIQKFYEKANQQYDDGKLLDDIIERMMPNPNLMNEIRRVFSEKETIHDNASSELKKIRVEKQELEKNIRKVLQDIMKKEAGKLSENFYTIRNNRYVLPIKTEFRNSFKGILHDESQSQTTAYIEPQQLVVMNNRIQQLKVAEKKEIDRILDEMSRRVFAVQIEIEMNAHQVAFYDTCNAKAVYSFKQSYQPVTTLDRQAIKLYDCQHPLLAVDVAIGNDIFVGGAHQILAITGANTGGKSVFLKTIGLMVLMHQTGLFLPVNDHKENSIGCFDRIFIDIGDEQSLEQNLSTFSAHITNVKMILNSASKNSLVLLDELGSGTDPLQGSALSIAILEALEDLKTQIILTTHFNEVKEFIAKHPKAQNAAMSFDTETLKPTYEVRYGSYGQSYAFDIARSLELPSYVIDNAKHQLEAFEDESLSLLTVYEEKLKGLEDDIRENEEQKLALVQKQKLFDAKVENKLNELSRKEATLEKEVQKRADKKLEQVEKIFNDLKDKRSLKINEQADITNQLNELNKGQISKRRKDNGQRQQTTVTFLPGDQVYVETLGSNGTLVEANGKNKWQVKIGSLNMSVAEKDLSFINRAKKEEVVQAKGRVSMSSVRNELDLRGVRVADGLDMLENYLANAKASHESVRIIHGHGTGQMRDAVQAHLKQHPYIRGYRYGGEGEGGVGVTVVEF